MVRLGYAVFVDETLSHKSKSLTSVSEASVESPSTYEDAVQSFA
jgi:hypothetical protein